MTQDKFESLGLDYNVWYKDESGGGVYAWRADIREGVDIVFAETVSDDGELESQAFYFEWEDEESNDLGSEPKLTKSEFDNMCTLVQGFYINKLAKIKINYEQ